MILLMDYLLCYLNAFLLGVLVGIGAMIFIDIREGSNESHTHT